MTGALALIGGGEWTEGCAFDADLLEASGGTQVAVVPAGSAYEDPAELVRRARTWFTGLGAEVIEVPVLMRPDAYADDAIHAVRSARFVYLAGTSPMHLRSVLKGTPVWDALVAAWHDGAVVAGSAAGADVLCDPMVDTRGGAFTVGLGLVEGLAVIPRSNTWSHDKIHRTVALAPSGLALAEVPEGTALLRSGDGTWTSAGVGTVTIHQHGGIIDVADLRV